MGLINLRTDLKSLKFGNDEYNGGNSGQPFIQTRIPATDEPLQTGFSNIGPAIAGLGAGAAIGAIGGSILGSAGAGAAVGAALGLGIGIAGANATTDGIRLPSAGTGGPDFLVRGGTLLPGRIVNDEIRLTKFFKSTNGVLFVVKQNLLSRIAVKTQSSPRLLNDGVYTPLSTLAQAAGNAFGLHVNKQGLNPFGSFLGKETYFGVVNEKIIPQSDNRLITLTKEKIQTGLDDVNVWSYGGGPNSFLGIGKTNIAFATDNTGAPLKTSAATTDNTLNYKELSEIPTFNPQDGSSFYVGYIPIGDPTILGKSKDLNPGAHSAVKVGDFRKNLREKIYPVSPDYTQFNIEDRVNLGTPGSSYKLGIRSYSLGVFQFNPGAINLVGAAGGDTYDKINWLPIYNSSEPVDSDSKYKDLVKFRIGVINNDAPTSKTYIHFRAFLDQISDSYTSTWDPTRYIGRGENFYTYGGFDRKVSLGWTVAAQSKAELIPMYRKLNYLASICAPDYNDGGYMRGNIVTLTIGGYFYEQPGIITSLNYEMNDDNSTWEIGIDDIGVTDSTVKELPHLIKVTGFNFIPIHQFVPRKQQFSGNIEVDNTGISPEMKSTYGPERYISLQDSTSTGYNFSYRGTNEA